LRLFAAPAERVRNLLPRRHRAGWSGGTSLFGGRGGIGKHIVGMFVLGVLNNGSTNVKRSTASSNPHSRTDRLISLSSTSTPERCARREGRAVEERHGAHGAVGGVVACEPSDKHRYIGELELGLVASDQLRQTGPVGEDASGPMWTIARRSAPSVVRRQW